jgi:hypothetical protein
VVAVFFLCISTSAQFWAKKEHVQWSAQECDRLLSDSPWAKTFRIQDFAPQRQRNQLEVKGQENPPDISYTAIFYSALPVQQALARKTLLAVDQPSVPAPAHLRDFREYWKNTNPDVIAQSSFLNIGKEKIGPLAVDAPDASNPDFGFVFPRVKDGKPVVGPEAKSVALEFQHPRTGTLATQKVVISFDVKKMMLGEAAFF